MGEFLAQFGGWLTAIVVAIIAAISSVLPKRGSIENTRIDQLQEDLEAERGERKALATEMSLQKQELQGIRTQQEHLARRDLAWMLHYEIVKQGVAMGNIPPWPPLPEILGGPNAQ